MPIPRPWEVRLTPIDLFVEKRRVGWLWKAIVTGSICLTAIGYTFYPFAISVTDTRTKPRQVQSTAVLTASICLVLFGHALELFVLIYQRSILFWLEDLFAPLLQLTFITGVVAPILHFFFRHLQFSIAFAGIFILSIVSLAIHIPIAALISRRISQIETVDLQRRQRVAASPSSPWPARMYSGTKGSSFSLTTPSQSFKRARSARSRAHSDSSRGNTNANSPSDDYATHLLPEDEAQRHQLMRLLQKKESDVRPPMVTGPQGGGVQSTYRLDLPIPGDVSTRRNSDVSIRTYGPNRISPTYTPNRDDLPQRTRSGPPRAEGVASGISRGDMELEDHRIHTYPGPDPVQDFRTPPAHDNEIMNPFGDTAVATAARTELPSNNDHHNDPQPDPPNDYHLQSQQPQSQPAFRPPPQPINEENDVVLSRMSPSQRHRERRRREIELGEGDSNILPAYSPGGRDGGNGTQRDHDARRTGGEDRKDGYAFGYR